MALRIIPPKTAESHVYWLMNIIAAVFFYGGIAILIYGKIAPLSECYIDVRYAGDNFTDYDSCSGQYIPRKGIEGRLYLPTPVDACSYISPPPGGFPTNSTWIALVYDYPACPTEMVINIRNAGYKLIIASSKNDSHRTITREASDTLFPIVVVEENYTDYLKENALSFSTDNPILVSAHGRSIDISLGALGWIICFTPIMPICIILIVRDCVTNQCIRCDKYVMERNLQKTKNLRRNFEKDINDQPQKSRFLQRKYILSKHYNSTENFKKAVLKGFADLKSHRINEAAVLEQLSKFYNAVGICSQHFRTSLLHYACLNGWNDIVKDLIEKYSCDPNVKIYAPSNMPTFPYKIYSIDCFLYTTMSEIDDYDEYKRDGEQDLTQSFEVSDGTAIHCACKAGYLDIVKFLIEKGCDPECKNIAGATPLHFACWKGHLDIVRFLVEKGCDPACTTAGLTPLHLACWKGHLDTVKFLVEKGCDPKSTDYMHKGYTPLHIACKYGQLDVVKFLVEEQHCDHLQPTANKSSVTPLDLANSHSHFHVSSFLASPGVSRQARYEYLSRSSFPPAFKVFVMGNHSAGKSTLVKAIQNRLTNTKWFGSFTDRFKRVSGVELNTAGIIPISIDSKRLGNIIMYDLAGQHEYYSSHAALLEKLVAYPGSLLMIVVDLSKDKNEIIQQLQYWSSFIESHCIQSGRKPDVVIVGSHADVVKSQQEKPKEKSTGILKTVSSNLQMPQEIIPLNCTQLASGGLTEVYTVIGNYCSQFRQEFSTDIRLNFLHAFLCQDFESVTACRVSEIVSNISMEEWDAETVSQYLTTISDKSHFLYLRSDQDVKDSWVILDQGVLLSEVNGTVFAPEKFKEHHDISSSTGIVPFSRIKESFPKHDAEMIVSFMSHLEFCHQVAESEAALVLGDSKQQFEKQLYFFPALVSEDRPKESCKSIEQTHYKCGWSLHCIQSNQFLSPRFLHVLLLRLAFSFALVSEKVEEDEACPVLQRRCNVWKNGIHWQNRDGVEAIVEVVEQNTAVTVVMGCLKGSELACTRLRSEVIRTILEVKKRFCGAVELRESLIHPAELSSYPLKSPKLLPSFTITELATAIAEDKQVVTNKQGHHHSMLEIGELLYFEPYTCYNSVLLAEIFKDDNSDKKAPSKFYTHSDIRKLLSEPNPTYKALRSVLDKYSVFCGRNLMLLTDRTLHSPLTSASSTSIVTLQPTVNWQYCTMSKNSADITRTLAANKLSERLAGQLRARGMIGETVYAHATNHGPDITEYTRMKHLTTAILTSTESNPQRYYDFITVLQMDGIREDAEAALALLPTDPPSASPEAVTQHQQQVQQTEMCTNRHTASVGKSAEKSHLAKPMFTRKPQGQEIVIIELEDLSTNPDGSLNKSLPTRQSYDHEEDLDTIPHNSNPTAARSHHQDEDFTTIPHRSGSNPIPPNQSPVDEMFADSFPCQQSPLESLASSSPVDEQVPPAAEISSGLPLPEAPKYWVQSLELRPTDEAQLLNGEWLTDKHITAANKLLSKQYPTQNGLEDPLILFEEFKWTSDATNFVQVINLSRQHWVCVSNMHCLPGGVDVYDSIDSSTESVSLQKQVAAIMRTQNPSFKLHFINVQRQSGGSDCALFAIAYAVSLCSGRDPHHASYDQSQMRSHLHRCFIAGVLTPFPQSSRKRQRRRFRIRTTVDLDQAKLYGAI